MFFLYNLLEKNRERIILTLLKNVPKEVRAYARVPKSELKESIEHLYEAYTDLLVSGDSKNLQVIFKYVARARVAQSFKLSYILRAFLSFTPVMRAILQEDFRKINGNGRAQFNQAMAQIEQTAFDATALFADVFQEYLQSQVDEHNQYIQLQNQKLGIDLSKFILFRG